jgi:uncharacterized alkaline shock family protein YloU
MAIEAFTAVMLQLNVRYKTRVAPKVTGIRDVVADQATDCSGIKADPVAVDAEA